MDKDLSDSDCQASQDNDSDQSLVNKFKKNVSEIISNTPLSKWFRKQNDTPTSSVRRRQDDSDDDDDEDFHEFQPPTKRTKLPPTKETLSLNVSETLSPISSVNNVKKPLYKNFPEPIAGPSGYQTRKMLNSTSFTSESNVKSVKTFSETTENVFKNPRVLNSTSDSCNIVSKESQSDSEESTSGYSSGRIGSKEIVSQESSKQTSSLENSPRKARSLFQSSSSLLSDRSLSPNRNSSLSSRLPSFNPSTFGSSNFVDRTLSTKRILNSPFYNGHTVYGGASAYGRNSKRVPQDMRKVLRQSVSIKPVNKRVDKGDLQLGKTARRILDTLEQYSSPVSDAKKIPVASRKFRSEGTLTKYIGTNPYSVRETRSASNKELQVPSVTDLLKMKIHQQKTRLQDSTEAVRQIASKSKSVLNEESYQIPVQRENDRHTGKMKTKITSVRQRTHIDEAVPVVKLNPISLPIKELPKFDIIIPPPSQQPVVASSASIIFKHRTKLSPSPSKPLEQSATNSKPIESTVNATKLKEIVKSVEDQMEFKFSAPLVLAEYLKPLKALNNFKFSEPLIKKRRSIHPELDSDETKLVDGKKAKKNNGETLFNLESNKNTNSSSLMDKFMPKEGTWECSLCMIRNQADKTKCAACETSRSSALTGVSKNPTTTPFALADQFKAPSNTWECSTCLIRNKEDVQKCAACGTKKPETPLSNAPPKDNVPQTGPAPTFGFGDKFKSPSDTWECSTCMIRNKSDATKCVACEIQKPSPVATRAASFDAPFKAPVPSGGSGFGSRFTPPLSTWECPVCMIRNKNELIKCAACETAKSGAKGQTAVASFGGDFKKKDDEWECVMCMVRNKSTKTKCQCCESLKPGASLSSAAPSKTESSKVSSFNFGIDRNTATSFTFGIPPGSSQNTLKTNAVQAFGENREKLSQKEGDKPSFTFGVPVSTSSETTIVTETKKDTPTITFGVSKPSEKQNQSTPPAFTFGTPGKTEVAAQNKTAPTFSFGVTSKAQDATSTPALAFGLASTTTNKEKGGEAGEPKKNVLLKPSDKLPEKAAIASPGFSFGLSKSASSGSVSSTTSFKPSESSHTDGSPSKRSKPAGEASEPPKVPTFTFKAPTTNGDVNKASPFSKTSTDKSAAPPAIFSFSAPKQTGPTSAIVTPTFGNIVSKADSFKFGVTSPEAPKPINGFGFELTSSPFGAKEPTSNSGGKPFAFASPAVSVAPNPAPSATNPPPPAYATPTKPPMFQFGGATDSKLLFSTSSTESKPAPPQFSFGPTPNKTPAFGFGQSSAPSFNFAPSVPERGFGPTGKPVPPPQMFGAEPLFGAPPSSQSSAPNGMFNFGSATTTNQKAGFSFGGSSAGNEVAGAAAPRGDFGFGSSSASAPGFNFSSAAPSFDANVKPSFNFTGGAGITAFSAPPAQEGASMPQRKIKKAIRRTGR